MWILDILKAVQIALVALLICATAFVFLMIASYAKEELENNAAAMALFDRLKSTVEDLKKNPMIAEFQPLYGQTSLIDIEFFLGMVQQWMAPSKPRHTPRHTRSAQRNYFEDGFTSFARGFDRNGGLLEKRAPRHAEGLVGSPKYLQLG